MSAAAFPQRLAQSVAEFFTLREAEREVRVLPEASRTSLAKDLAVVAQRREAAETLWPRGSMVEALKLAHAALDAAVAALDSFATSVEASGVDRSSLRADSPSPAWLPRARAIVAEARTKTEGARVPELEADARPDDEDTFRTIVEALLALDHATGLSVATPKDIASLRRRRTATTGGLVAVTLLTAWWMSRVPPVAHVLVSGQIGGDPDAGAKVIDGDTKTTWLLPDRQPGWLELVLSKPMTVRSLRIATGNPPYNDREAKDIHVETFLNGAPVKATDATLPEPPPNDVGWTDVPVESSKADRIRISISTFYRLGGGIAEVEVK